MGHDTAMRLAEAKKASGAISNVRNLLLGIAVLAGAAVFIVRMPKANAQQPVGPADYEAAPSDQLLVDAGNADLAVAAVATGLIDTSDRMSLITQDGRKMVAGGNATTARSFEESLGVNLEWDTDPEAIRKLLPDLEEVGTKREVVVAANNGGESVSNTGSGRGGDVRALRMQVPEDAREVFDRAVEKYEHGNALLREFHKRGDAYTQATLDEIRQSYSSALETINPAWEKYPDSPGLSNFKSRLAQSIFDVRKMAVVR